MDRCVECGFAYDQARAVGTGADLIRAEAAELASTLGSTTDPAKRRDPAVWSPLEYACHVRDMLLTQRERVLLARRTEVPEAVPMGRDVRVEHEGYAVQDPVDVVQEIAMAARLFAGVLDRLGPEDWRRGLLYSYPDWSERSIAWVAGHTLHEIRHHLRDIRLQSGPPA